VTPDEGRALLDRLFGSIDAMDTEGMLSAIRPDATFRFGSAAEVAGHDAIREAVDAFFDSIAGIRHSLRLVLVDEDVLVCEGDVQYTRHDGRSLTLPFANVFGITNGLIGSYRIYVDIGPLYAA
jgi:ketosteroid isomerase-like protein